MSLSYLLASFKPSCRNALRYAKRRSALPPTSVHNQLQIQALLHLLLKISESVQRLENLLLLASPPDESSLEGLTDDYKSPVDDVQRPNAFTASEDDGAEEQYVILGSLVRPIPDLHSSRRGSRANLSCLFVYVRWVVAHPWVELFPTHFAPCIRRMIRCTCI